MRHSGTTGRGDTGMTGMRAYRISFYAGTSASLLVGLWHFFVPWMFQWYSYIPHRYENLIVGIDWTNLCFSFLLSGLSLLVLLWGATIFAGSHEALVVYGLLSSVWVFRVVLAVVEPWPLEPIAWAAYGQFAGAVSITALLLVPLARVVIAQRAHRV